MKAPARELRSPVPARELRGDFREPAISERDVEEGRADG
jgi:hypothetical protein